MASITMSFVQRLVTPLFWLVALFRGSPEKPVAAPPAPPVSFNPDPDYSPSLEDVPRYPPFDRGLPAIPVERVLHTQHALVERIRNSDLPYVEESVRNLALYVHLLPATTNDVFSGAGGLLRLCLETGFHSYIASQGNIFTSRDPAERRRGLEPKWQLAAFLAGLCCELGRAINTSVVTNDRGEQWLPFEPLTTWLERTDSARYFLRPPQSPPIHQTDPANLSGIILNSIIPPAALQYITTDDRSILMEMLNAISRISDTFHSSHFARSVRHIRDQVIARDQKSNPRTFGTPLVGVHVEPYLINAMRHLIKNGMWKRNEKLARVHLAPDGCFLFWSTGVPEILSLLRQEGAVGIPTDPRTLGELLLQSGVFEGNGKPGGTDSDGRSVLWWYIRPPGASTTYEVVKLSNPGIILEEEVIASTPIYSTDIVVAPPSPPAPPGASPVKPPPAAARPSLAAPASPEALQPPVAPSSTGPVVTTDEHASVVDPGEVDCVTEVAEPETPDSSLHPPGGLNQALKVVADISPAPTSPPRPAAATAAPPQPKPVSPKQRPTTPGKATSDRAASTGDRSPKPRKTSDPSHSDDVAPTPPPADLPLAERIKKLRPSTLGGLNKIAEWHNDPASNRKCLWQPEGLAISVTVIAEAGFQRGVLLTELKQIKVAVLASGKSSATHHINGAIYFMITSEAALAFGFNPAEELQ